MFTPKGKKMRTKNECEFGNEREMADLTGRSKM